MTLFYKYHGTGNDFIMIDNRSGDFDVTDSEKVKKLCDRRLGIGADGLILLENSDQADCFMNYYNSDGTIAEMCGNGVRCLAKFYLEQTQSGSKELMIDTRAGVKHVIVNNDGTYSVNMGIPVFTHADFPSDSIKFDDTEFNFVSMGNPHAVGLVENVSDLKLDVIGPTIEHDVRFPNKINVEFVEKISDDKYKVRVWERGCAETMACGTGACAVYAILKKSNNKLREVTLKFPGGNLYVSENGNAEIILRGEATFVFNGEYK